MTDIIPFESRLNVADQYKPMLDIISNASPEITRATGLFCKSQSQFMDNMMTVSHLTPIRNLRQILAEIEQTKLALGEAYYKIEKKKLKIQRKKEKLLNSSGIDRKEIELDIEKLEWEIANTTNYVNGAIRRYAQYVCQYQSIMKSHGVENFDELDFETEEEKYHICKAFQQALSAARAHGGYIDEGNQIYFEQIGINGTVAQVEMANYLNHEAEMLANGQEPPHEMQVNWFMSMADKFKGCSRKFAEWKGMSDTMNIETLIKNMEVNHEV